MFEVKKFSTIWFNVRCQLNSGLNYSCNSLEITLSCGTFDNIKWKWKQKVRKWGGVVICPVLEKKQCGKEYKKLMGTYFTFKFQVSGEKQWWILVSRCWGAGSVRNWNPVPRNWNGMKGRTLVKNRSHVKPAGSSLVTNSRCNITSWDAYTGRSLPRNNWEVWFGFIIGPAFSKRS